MEYRDKIVKRETLRAMVAALPRPLIFTNGVFDLLHPGHIDYLAAARALGPALVVGLNSDVSARLLEKGSDRPINPERDRALMLAGLESVSVVTLFDEQTPLALLELARPDLYVKGGDYHVETLAETALVNTWGGQARAIDFLPGYSTTRLIERIRASTPKAMRRALFLDRDGVINVDHGYVWQPEQFDVLPGVFEALRAAQALDYALIVVTNQSGIARGYFSAEDYTRLEAHMCLVFASEGVTFDGIYHCPHHPSGAEGEIPCACRKPRPGMILRAASDHAIDLTRSILVGDKASDLEAAGAAGVGRAYRVGEQAGGLSLADIVRSLEGVGHSNLARPIRSR